MSYPALPSLFGNISTLTVSGHSAGCMFSNNMLTIHSSIIKGAALLECSAYSIDLPDIQKWFVNTDKLVN